MTITHTTFEAVAGAMEGQRDAERKELKMLRQRVYELEREQKFDSNRRESELEEMSKFGDRYMELLERHVKLKLEFIKKLEAEYE